MVSASPISSSCFRNLQALDEHPDAGVHTTVEHPPSLRSSPRRAPPCPPSLPVIPSPRHQIHARSSQLQRAQWPEPGLQRPRLSGQEPVAGAGAGCYVWTRPSTAGKELMAPIPPPTLLISYFIPISFPILTATPAPTSLTEKLAAWLPTPSSGDQFTQL